MDGWPGADQSQTASSSYSAARLAAAALPTSPPSSTHAHSVARTRSVGASAWRSAWARRRA